MVWKSLGNYLFRKLGIFHYEACKLTLWSDECIPSFLTRNAGGLAHHPSSVMSPDDDDDDDDELRPTFSNCLNMCVELSTEVVSLDSSGCIAIHGFWCHWWKTL